MDEFEFQIDSKGYTILNRLKETVKFNNYLTKQIKLNHVFKQLNEKFADSITKESLRGANVVLLSAKRSIELKVMLRAIEQSLSNLTPDHFSTVLQAVSIYLVKKNKRQNKGIMIYFQMINVQYARLFCHILSKFLDDNRQPLFAKIRIAKSNQEQLPLPEQSWTEESNSQNHHSESPKIWQTVSGSESTWKEEEEVSPQAPGDSTPGYRSKQRKILDVKEKLQCIYSDKGLLASEENRLEGSNVVNVYVNRMHALECIEGDLLHFEQQFSITQISIAASKKRKKLNKGIRLTIQTASGQDALNLLKEIETAFENLYQGKIRPAVLMQSWEPI